MFTLIRTDALPFVKARSVNQESSTFVAKVPTGTEPRGDANNTTGSSIIELSPGENSLGGIAANGAVIVPFGNESNNTTFSMRIIGWRRIGANPQTALWIPVTLAEVVCTMANIAGQDGREIRDLDLFVDTIALVGTTGNANVSIDINSPADGVSIAHCVVDLKGFQKLELSFSTGSSADSCNALVALL